MSDKIEPYEEGLFDRILRIGKEDGVIKDIVRPFVTEKAGELLHQLTDYYFFDRKSSGYSHKTSSGIEVVDYRGVSEKKSGSRVSTATASKNLVDRPYETQAQARTVLDSLKVTLQEYGEVRVQDYYRAANIVDRNFELANKWGWREEDIKVASIVRKGLKWYIELPAVKWLEADDKEKK